MTDRCRGDAGQVGGIEALPFGLLIFVVGSLLIANAWAVVDAKFATDAAARQAVRTYVEGDDPDVALEDARAAGLDAVEAHGRDPERAIVGPVGEATLERCTQVTFEVEYEVPALSLPFIGGYGRAPFRVRSAHSELVDPFRSGLPGDTDSVRVTRTSPRERGSVLMLMPAGVLVVLLLGAIAFDMSLVFLRQRQASSLATDVANDLATAAFDEGAFRRDGDFRLDPTRAADLGIDLVTASDLGDLIEEVEVAVVGPDEVTVRVVVRVDYVFARALPGAADGTTVTAAATAIASPG